MSAVDWVEELGVVARCRTQLTGRQVDRETSRQGHFIMRENGGR